MKHLLWYARMVLIVAVITGMMFFIFTIILDMLPGGKYERAAIETYRNSDHSPQPNPAYKPAYDDATWEDEFQKGETNGR